MSDGKEFIKYANKKSYDNFLFFIICTLLVLVSGFRPLGLDRDSLTYVDLINRPISEIWFQEPTFIFFTLINKFFFGETYRFFFILYACLGIVIKFIAIKKFKVNKFIALFVYISLYFVLHDMTQIRVGVASAFFMLSLSYYKENKNRALVFQLCAILFHYSALAGLAIYLLRKAKLNKTLCLCFILFSLSISKFITQSFILDISFYFPDFLSVKIKNYIYMLNESGTFQAFNQYNYFYLGLVFFIAISLLNKKSFLNNDEMYNYELSIKLLLMMILTYYLLAPVPILAGRFSEFFGIALIIYFPYFVKMFKPRVLSVSLVFVFISIHAVRLNLALLNF